PIPAHALTLYVKEVLNLPEHKIEERFSLQPGHGAIIGMLGWPTAGVVGKAGIWTNKDSLSIIVGGYLNQIVESRLSPYHMLQRLKEHPMVKRLIQGAKVEEYMAHMIPKGGYNYQPKMFGDGVLVAGDAAVMVSGRRGTDLAMLSGKLAAETVIQAKARGDFSEVMMSNYKHKLDDTFFMKDIQARENKLLYFKRYRDSDFIISSMANKVAYEFFNDDMLTAPEKMTKLKKAVTNQQHVTKSLLDIYQAIRFWGPF
ncbi:MAG: FAD-dependent oxidoreductase, partial [Bacillota bacterium]|nr:FAD-dependent oxidoreductase [Bacillota bacterium]